MAQVGCIESKETWRFTQVSFCRWCEMAKRKYVNENYFKTWSSRMAWVLGFWAADGCASYSKKNGGQAIISFAQKNRDIIVQIKTLLESENKISENNTGVFILGFSSEIIHRDLCEIFNMPTMQKKSLWLRFPEVLPIEYTRDFLRGLIDGDECIRWADGTPSLDLASGSRSIVKGFRDKVIELTGIYGTVNERNIKNYNLRYYGMAAVCLSFFLYWECCLTLPRKKTIAGEFWEWESRFEKNITERTKDIFPVLFNDGYQDDLIRLNRYIINDNTVNDNRQPLY
jgi:hypothetical protein